MLRILVIENFTCSLPEGFGAGTQGEITTMYNLKVMTFTAATQLPWKWPGSKADNLGMLLTKYEKFQKFLCHCWKVDS